MRTNEADKTVRMTRRADLYLGITVAQRCLGDTDLADKLSTGLEIDYDELCAGPAVYRDPESVELDEAESEALLHGLRQMEEGHFDTEKDAPNNVEYLRSAARLAIIECAKPEVEEVFDELTESRFQRGIQAGTVLQPDVDVPELASNIHHTYEGAAALWFMTKSKYEGLIDDQSRLNPAEVTAIHTPVGMATVNAAIRNSRE